MSEHSERTVEYGSRTGYDPIIVGSVFFGLTVAERVAPSSTGRPLDGSLED